MSIEGEMEKRGIKMHRIALLIVTILLFNAIQFYLEFSGHHSKPYSIENRRQYSVRTVRAMYSWMRELYTSVPPVLRAHTKNSICSPIFNWIFASKYNNNRRKAKQNNNKKKVFFTDWISWMNETNSISKQKCTETRAHSLALKSSFSFCLFLLKFYHKKIQRKN